MQKFTLLPGAKAQGHAPCLHRKVVINQRTLHLFMRLNVIAAAITFTSTQLLMAAPGKGQTMDKATVTLSVQHESLKAALSRIERQAEVRFIYTQEQVAAFNNISIPKGTRTIGEQLDLLLAGTPLRYRVVNDHFIIYNQTSEAPTTSNAITAEKEDGVIRGKITDTKGDPIFGATIHLAGTAYGTTTNTEGVFVIKGLKEGTYTITVSSIGFEKHPRQSHWGAKKPW